MNEPISGTITGAKIPYLVMSLVLFVKCGAMLHGWRCDGIVRQRLNDAKMATIREKMKRLTLTLASTTFAFLLAAGGEGEPEATTLNFDALDPPPELSLLVKAKQ